MKRVLIISGGTGGHIFPALEIARALRYQGISVYWLGTVNGLEKKLVSHEFPLQLIQIRTYRNQGLIRSLFMPFYLVRAIFQSYRIIKKIKPKMILGMGGYVSGPGGFVAWINRIPMIIHEQNVISGLTNRLLARTARSVLQAFPGAFSDRNNVKTTGNPIRSELLNTPLPRIRLMGRRGPLRVLILGGSQGSYSINQKIVETLRNYPHSRELTIWHQTGLSDFERTKDSYNTFKTLSFEIRLDAFIDDMCKAYTWSDLVVCRSGALTVSEIISVGVASIFIPYPYATDNHQFHNGRLLEQKGAAIIISEKSLTNRCLVHYFKRFFRDRGLLLVMSECARNLSKRGAVQNIVNECKRIL
ncbi:undecaprenyldiphospho-muramoylpentapeptide beta-N-acetylglucosaminyltransferase [Coxiella endosymbiont of Amblyomma sculptum]|uniref:undecaprenyldiphospho-muramoylpentapeptide beta-N-acetylglucosaminyltransferase n=1 Tax=Coxiella endosymbiont of Amblyomma sculptum TaxID=2487929 RepID=UPI00132F390A|nr:undecaprenyldiphospho-muramoylpentapeptide beta-N-acetylglucosaminyltransferase [Coxiella endosymbiont of Amblyomma sculptum]QHG92412.1 undecaprenyldiphospho-muramoylpentapeptide beta-N-acetylglucosaminyltransferase [Coxiella endosymbiont of Amblyomma sculptum]